MDELREPLKLPKIGGALVASYRQDKDFITMELKDFFSWNVRFVFSGPDQRYNSAFGYLSNDDEVQKFIASLQEALQIMKVLESQSFKGTYSKTVNKYSYRTPEIVVESANGRTSVYFWLSSGTHRFCRTLSSSEIAVCIEKLKPVPQKGQQMIETLKSLTVGLVEDKPPETRDTCLFCNGTGIAILLV